MKRHASLIARTLLFNGLIWLDGTFYLITIWSWLKIIWLPIIKKKITWSFLRNIIQLCSEWYSYHNQMLWADTFFFLTGKWADTFSTWLTIWSCLKITWSFLWLHLMVLERLIFIPQSLTLASVKEYICIIEKISFLEMLLSLWNDTPASSNLGWWKKGLLAWIIKSAPATTQAWNAKIYLELQRYILHLQYLPLHRAWTKKRLCSNTSQYMLQRLVAKFCKQNVQSLGD